MTSRVHGYGLLDQRVFSANQARIITAGQRSLIQEYYRSHRGSRGSDLAMVCFGLVMIVPLVVVLAIFADEMSVSFDFAPDNLELVFVGVPFLTGLTGILAIISSVRSIRARVVADRALDRVLARGETVTENGVVLSTRDGLIGHVQGRSTVIRPLPTPEQGPPTADPGWFRISYLPVLDFILSMSPLSSPSGWPDRAAGSDALQRLGALPSAEAGADFQLNRQGRLSATQVGRVRRLLMSDIRVGLFWLLVSLLLLVPAALFPTWAGDGRPLLVTIGLGIAPLALIYIARKRQHGSRIEQSAIEQAEGPILRDSTSVFVGDQWLEVAPDFSPLLHEGVVYRIHYLRLGKSSRYLGISAEAIRLSTRQELVTVSQHERALFPDLGPD